MLTEPDVFYTPIFFAESLGMWQVSPCGSWLDYEWAPHCLNGSREHLAKITSVPCHLSSIRNVYVLVFFPLSSKKVALSK